MVPANRLPAQTGQGNLLYPSLEHTERGGATGMRQLFPAAGILVAGGAGEARRRLAGWQARFEFGSGTRSSRSRHPGQATAAMTPSSQIGRPAAAGLNRVNGYHGTSMRTTLALLTLSLALPTRCTADDLAGHELLVATLTSRPRTLALRRAIGSNSLKFSFPPCRGCVTLQA